MERFSKTLRLKIHRFLTAKDTMRYTETLPLLVSAYNETVHTSMGRAPNDVTHDNQMKVFYELYEGGEHGGWAKRNVKRE